MWGDNGSVRLLDVTEQLRQLAAEVEVASKAASKVQVSLLHSKAASAAQQTACCREMWGGTAGWKAMVAVAAAAAGATSMVQQTATAAGILITHQQCIM